MSATPRALLGGLLSAVLAGGCGGDACDTPWYLDEDGDGYGVTSTVVHACEEPEGMARRANDCDDANPAIHPGRVERCDGVDENCDGLPDEGPLWYADGDGDGWGTTRLTLRACAAPEGFVDRGGDCDDDDDAAFPGAEERCNGQDDDCDALVDEGAPGEDLWYPDADADGYGSEAGATALCVGPLGWTTRGGDCDDTHQEVSPDRFELCNGIDDDCDGLADSDDPSLVNGVLAWPDEDGDGHGASAAQASIVCSLVGASTDAADCDDDDPAVHVGATEVCGGRDEDCDGLVDDDDPDLDVSTGIALWSDLDGDGYGDPQEPRSVCQPRGGLAANDLDCDDLDRWVGPDVWLRDADGDGAGAGAPVQGTGCVAPPGTANVAALDCDDTDPNRHPGAPDVCGDGVDQDCSGYDSVCRDAFDPFQDLDDVARATVARAADRRTVPAGDLDGDGFQDLAIIGATSDLTVLFGPPSPTGVFEATVHFTLAAPAASAAVVDSNLDGATELALGLPDIGSVQVVGGPRHQLATTAELVSVFGYPPDAGQAIASLDERHLAVSYSLGVSVVDVTGPYLAQGCTMVGLNHPSVPATDGHFDGSVDWFAVSDPTHGAGRGMIFLVEEACDTGVFGSLARVSALGDPGTELGVAAAFGDLDGDGHDDLVATSTVVQQHAGTAFVWMWPRQPVTLDDAAMVVFGDSPNDEIGSSVTATDVDGDGAAELLVGAPAVDLVGPGSGAVYVFEATNGVLTTADAD
ncbi:MAG: VCBS repeat-containing protein [Myxococcales bacterium]|nr:VCBS repeat-containing protein [Myxococcales bacterium]